MTTFSGLFAASTGRIRIRSMIAPPTKNERPSSRGARARSTRPVVGEPPGDEGGEQRHLALGEVEQPGGPVDEHEGQGHRGVDHADADAVDDLSRGRAASEPQVRLADARRPPRAPRRCPGRRSRRSRARSRRWPISSARLAFCSTTSMVRPSVRLISPSRSNSSRVMSGARPSDGSSSSSSRGRLISARAMASICCSPPDMRAGRLVAALAEAGERLVPALEVGVDLAVLAGDGAEPEVLVDGEVAEGAPALRHVGDARAGDGLRGCRWPSSSPPSKRIAPEACRASRRWPAAWWSCRRRWPRGSPRPRPSSTVEVEAVQHLTGP